MLNFLLPPPESTCFTIQQEAGKDPVKIEIIDVVDTWNKAREQAAKLDTEWLAIFVKEMRQLNVVLSKTTAVVLVERAVSELANLKKSCSPEQEP